ncbi:hypothetical protein F1559_001181 [Cyanidiococcus yangmingshanensis]|uniref:Uncharacterized protein n=1 Tax=Cyanidiococcus yangmingshanensis TaxID=2690220 RepID=A0A7J7ICZ9_9RHOD|nr:hypothetical protein F1559_001181 [Cyanidiococcus yangmingshanensis]
MEAAQQVLKRIQEQNLVHTISEGRVHVESTGSDELPPEAERTVHDENGSPPVVAAWQHQAAALRSLRSLLSAAGVVGTTSNPGSLYKSENCWVFEFCVSLWKLEQAAINGEGVSEQLLPSPGNGALLIALAKVCVDIRSQLSKEGLEFVGWFGQNILGPALIIQQEQVETPRTRPQTSSEKRAERRRTLRREVAALRELNQQDLLPNVCGLRSGASWRRHSSGVSELPRLEASTKCPPRDKKAEQIGCVAAFASTDAESSASACAGGEPHPVLRERCGFYACRLLGINGLSERLPEADGTFEKPTTPTFWEDVLIRAEIQKTIQIAIRDPQVSVRDTARQLFRALQENLPNEASAMIEKLPPEDRRRLLDSVPALSRPTNVHRFLTSRAQPLGDASQRQNREHKVTVAETRQENVDLNAGINALTVNCRGDGHWISM